MANIIDKECNKVLVKTFYKNAGYGLRKGNGYQQTILEPRFDELDERVKDIYPEYYQLYKGVKESYLEEFRALYSDRNKSNDAEQSK